MTSTDPKLEMRIRKLLQGFKPTHLNVENESHMHKSGKGAETHFKITIVSESFTGKSLVTRHRTLYQHLSKEMADGVHALALHCFTPKEWKEKGHTESSPVCAGGE
jgi:BolA family transcriptional regulator, general stress-responsive regulator